MGFPINSGSGGVPVEGFNDFIQRTYLTAVNGLPGANQFRSDITNRSKCVDIAKDLSLKMGVDRFLVQQIIEVPIEFGPSGQKVYKSVNDYNDQIRFVGNWLNSLDSSGPRVVGQSVNDYIEIVFHGTGLNILTTGSGSRDVRVSVDGGAEGGSTIFPSNVSSILVGRNYPANMVVQAASGLSTGIHTVKIRANDSNLLHIHGFEILHSSNLIFASSGLTFIGGKKASHGASENIAFDSSFESGTLATKGGKVLVYQKTNGSVAKALTPVAASTQYLASSDHSTEQIMRSFFWREFGAGRSDDFSTLNGTGDRAFTLDDGVTSLTGFQMNSDSDRPDRLITGVSNAFATFTFVGSGIDILRRDNSDGFTVNMDVIIDGASIGSLSSATSQNARVEKIASGLPYGSHTLKLLRTGGDANFGVVQFLVYEPKKPTLPTNAIGLAEYNIVANFNGTTATGTSVASNLQMPTGVILKSTQRDMLYSGSNWVLSVPDPNLPSGSYAGTITNNNQPVKAVFFGTGASIHMYGSSGGTYDFTVKIDGTLNASFTARANITNLGGGSYRFNVGTSQVPARLDLSSLTLGIHTIEIERSGGSGNFQFVGLNIITPIHAFKPSTMGSIQGASLVGSQSIGDLRKISPLSDTVVKEKRYAQAFGISNNPSTSATSFVPVPDLQLIFNGNDRLVKISFGLEAAPSGSADYEAVLFVDGKQLGNPDVPESPNGSSFTMDQEIMTLLPFGPHLIQAMWRSTGGAAITARKTGRYLIAEEV